MKYIKTPKIHINNVDYTEELKGKTLIAGQSVAVLDIDTLPNETLNIKVKSPIKITGTAPIQMYKTYYTLFGKKYNNYNNYSVILDNVEHTAISVWDICGGKLYYNNTLFNEDVDWEDLSYSSGVNISSLEENYLTFAIKGGELYKLCLLTVSTPQEPIITITPLYAWTLEDKTVYTLTEFPTFGTNVYEWDGETLTTDGTTVYNMDVIDYTTVTIYLSTNTDGYNRDIEHDDERITRTEQPDIITYEPTITKIDTEYQFKQLTNTVDWEYMDSSYSRNPFFVYGLTTDNKLVSINRTGTIAVLLENVIQMNDMYMRNILLVECNNGDIYRVYFNGYPGTNLTIKKLYTLPKKSSIILPGGTYGGDYPLPAKCIICDGNLYAGANCISSTGSWTQVSIGYECGYGIDDGKLYKIYGTNSSWYSKRPSANDITLVDSTKIWIYVWCLYNYAYAFTNEGEMYFIKDTTLTKQRTISIGDYNADYKEYSYTINAGEQSEIKSITLPLQLINTLIDES